MRVAITGPMYSGKTTLGRLLEKKYGWYFMDYTGSIKQHLATALNAVYKTNHVNVDDINRDKKQYRSLLQELGSYLGYDNGYYVDEMLEQWRNSEGDELPPEPVYFDNVRFPAQYAALKDAGFVLIGLQISNCVQEKRAEAAGVASNELERFQNHKAEAGVVPDFWMDGERDVRELADALDTLADKS